MQRTVVWELNRQPMFLVSAVMAIVALLAMFVLIWKGLYRTIMRDSVAYSVLGVMTLVLMYGIRRGSRKKFVRVRDVKVVDMKEGAGSQ
jgi:hypothetical protein